MIPNFLVVGAGKAGTSWLQVCLEEHPDIFVPFQKETNYFSLEYTRGINWYNNFFKSFKSEKVAGEVCPSYMVHNEVPERVHAINPGMKLVFICRSPLERAYSHYCMLLRAGKANENVDEELHPDSRLVQEGRYFHHITRFREYFPLDQIKIVFFEDIKSEPRALLREVYGFLGVDPEFTPSMLNRAFHERRPRPSFTLLYNLAVNITRAISRNHIGHSVVTYLRKKGVMGIAYRIMPQLGYPAIGDIKRKELIDFFKKEIEELSSLTGRDLSSWLEAH